MVAALSCLRNIPGVRADYVRTFQFGNWRRTAAIPPFMGLPKFPSFMQHHIVSIIRHSTNSHWIRPKLWDLCSLGRPKKTYFLFPPSHLTIFGAPKYAPKRHIWPYLANFWERFCADDFTNIQGALDQCGTTSGAIDETRRSSKAIDKCIIKNFRDKNVVIACLQQ